MRLSVDFFRDYPEGIDSDRLKTDADIETKTTTITLQAKYYNGIVITTNIPYLFAGDEDFLYYINIWFRGHGEIETLTTAFDFTVYKKPNR